MSDSNILFIFPGQGSQYRGMGADLVEAFPVAADVYDRASARLGYDMRRLSFEDPEGELDRTRFTQPALLTHQYACLQAFLELAGGAVQPTCVAGHSLGEYTALVAAGALDFETALGLVAARGRLMSEHGRGSMLATSLDMVAARDLADRYFCGIGGANLPDQTVIAGEEADLDRLAADLADNYRGKRGMRLNTEGAFHTYLMVSAAEQFRAELDQVSFGALETTVLSNYTGTAHIDDADSIRSRLFFQLFNPVRWVDCMSAAIDSGLGRVYEFGGGIGKGEGPEEKRPNLETIVKKSLKWKQHQAEYIAAINAPTVQAAASPRS